MDPLTGVRVSSVKRSVADILNSVGTSAAPKQMVARAPAASSNAPTKFANLGEEDEREDGRMTEDRKKWSKGDRVGFVKGGSS